MVRRVKTVLVVSALVVAGVVIVLGEQTLSNPEFSWHDLVTPFAAIVGAAGAGELLAWYTFKPAALKADAMKISLLDGLDTTRMSRSDLAFIFRGQVLRPTRGAGYWDKSYIFAASDGTVWLTPKASGFTENGIVEFAGRLQVPVRGDFSVQVKDSVDPAAG
jgi:hypothetical protein